MSSLSSNNDYISDVRLIRGYICNKEQMKEKTLERVLRLLKQFVKLYGEESLYDLVYDKDELVNFLDKVKYDFDDDFDENKEWGSPLKPKRVYKETIKILNSNEIPNKDIDKDELHYLAALKYTSLYKRAKNKRIPFDLTISDIKKMLKRKRCQMSGCVIDYSLPDSNNNKLTFDRCDSSKGYTKDNVVIVALWVNQLKCELFEKDQSMFKYKKSDIKALANIMNYLNNRLNLNTGK